MRGPRHRPYWLVVLDQAESYYRECRRGLEAHPALDEDAGSWQSFGIPVEMRVVGASEAVVLPWGWYTLPEEC